jgi:hypothetical protein
MVFSGFCIGQNDTTGKIRYSPAYQFNNGLYITFDQVLQNKPMPFERIISGNKNDDNWLDLVLKSDKISFLDDYGVHQVINTNDVWGYCNNGALYVNWSKDFYRIPYIGKISHYVATQTVRVDNFVDPYYGYYPGMGPSYETSKVVQNIIDFESGKSYPFTVETIQPFLMKDPVLFDEFNQLKKNKKKQMLFLYIRRYNEKNPLYLPEQ